MENANPNTTTSTRTSHDDEIPWVASAKSLPDVTLTSSSSSIETTDSSSFSEENQLAVMSTKAVTPSRPSNVKTALESPSPTLRNPNQRKSVTAIPIMKPINSRRPKNMEQMEMSDTTTAVITDLFAGVTLTSSSSSIETTASSSFSEDNQMTVVSNKAVTPSRPCDVKTEVESPAPTKRNSRQLYSVAATAVVTPSRPKNIKQVDMLHATAAVNPEGHRLASPRSVTILQASPSFQDHTIVWLIRHGESLGQLAPRTQRLTDVTLLDCGLSERGQQQARSMPTRYHLPPMDYILTSPLTRALQTALLGFPDNRHLMVHYDLCELGAANIPENQPRPLVRVLNELDAPRGMRIDVQSAPHHTKIPNVLRRQYIRQVFQWLAASTTTTMSSVCPPPQHIAVVCHFHVIRAALADEQGFCSPQLKPHNAAPIPCVLTPEGRLIPC
eukprot:Sro322_g117070.2  (443) ;mRNA; r:45997-47325